MSVSIIGALGELALRRASLQIECFITQQIVDGTTILKSSMPDDKASTSNQYFRQLLRHVNDNQFQFQQEQIRIKHIFQDLL